MKKTLEELLQYNRKGDGKLEGTDGNVYSVIGFTISCLRKSDWSFQDLQDFRELAMDQDTYEDVIALCNSVLEEDMSDEEFWNKLYSLNK